MTFDTGDSTPSKSQRRHSAREKARQLRVEQRKKDFRNRLILQGSLVFVVLAIIAAVVMVITSSIKPPEPGPRNMLSDGVKVGENLEAVRTQGLPPSGEPVPSASNEPSTVLDIRIYGDYLCANCGGFEQANSAQIKKLVSDGSATVEIHPIATLDRLSMGSKYSSRAANAAACVANYSPDSFFNFNALLFKNQPQENSTGLTDEKIIELAKEAGVVSTFKKVSQCIEKQSFKVWVMGATDRFTSNPLPNVAVQPESLETPTIYVNGQLYEYTIDPNTKRFDPNEFAKFYNKVLGADFTETSAATPTPTPTPAP